MEKIVLLSKRLSNTPVEDLIEAGFTFKQYLDSVQCCLCGFETKGTLSIDHIQFMHKLLNPDCEMVKHIVYNFNNYRNAKKCISETEKMMLSTFKNWPTRLRNIEKLVAAGFYYTGVGKKLACIECKTILHNWKITDDPWTVHESTSPDCLFVKIHK